MAVKVTKLHLYTVISLLPLFLKLKTQKSTKASTLSFSDTLMKKRRAQVNHLNLFHFLTLSSTIFKLVGQKTRAIGVKVDFLVFIMARLT